MKKAAISVSALLVCGALAGILCMKDNKPAASANQTANVPVVQNETTRQPAEYETTFTAVSVPEEMKQHFTVNSKATQVITGKSGTMLLIPDNAFADKNGLAAEGKVKLELIEALTPQDLIAMNMGTMADAGMLETGGTIYVGAKSESGEVLQLAEGKTIEAEIPTSNRKPGMQLWEGKTNEDGSVTWVKPQPINESLTEVSVETLGEIAAPDVVETVADDNMEMRGWLRVDRIQTLITGQGVQVRDTLIRWKGDSVVVPGFMLEQPQNETNHRFTGVNFADPKFENTNIATAEFRSRLPYIKQSCDPRIAHCYADHPERELWLSDAEAADSLEKFSCPLSEVFRQFANLKQGKVDPKDPRTVAAMDAARNTAIKNYSERTRIQLAAFESYKFGMKQLGWANIDRLYGSGKPIVFNARVSGGDGTGNPIVSLLIPSRGIYLPGYKRPNGDYSFTHGESEQAMAYPHGEKAIIVARIGSGSNLIYGTKEIVFSGNVVEQVEMKKGTEQELQIALGNIPTADKEPENKIIDDWYTRSIKNGSGCVCGGLSEAMN